MSYGNNGLLGFAGRGALAEYVIDSWGATREQGATYSRTTAGSYTSLAAVARINVPIELTSVGYPMFAAGTYRLSIYRESPTGRLIYTSNPVVASVSHTIIYFPINNLLIGAALGSNLYAFQFNCNTSGRWDDASNIGDQLYDGFTILQGGYYGGTLSAYVPALRIVGKFGVPMYSF